MKRNSLGRTKSHSLAVVESLSCSLFVTVMNRRHVRVQTIQALAPSHLHPFQILRSFDGSRDHPDLQRQFRFAMPIHEEDGIEQIEKRVSFLIERAAHKH